MKVTGHPGEGNWGILWIHAGLRTLKNKRGVKNGRHHVQSFQYHDVPKETVLKIVFKKQVKDVIKRTLYCRWGVWRQQVMTLSTHTHTTPYQAVCETQRWKFHDPKPQTFYSRGEEKAYRWAKMKQAFKMYIYL